MNSWEAWGDSMSNCTETNGYFDSIKANVEDFLTLDNWQDIAQANYAAQEAVIDQQWGYYLQTWDQGVYLSAGMFYGRVYMALTAGSFSYTNRVEFN